MLPMRPSFDWQILEEDEEWEAATQTATQPDVQPAASTGRAAIAVAVCLATLLIVTGSVLYRRADSNLARIDYELGNVVAMENRLQQQDNPDLANALIDPEAPHVWKTWMDTNRDHQHPAPAPSAATIKDMKLAGEWAMVRVRINEPVADWQTGPFLETRFYRMSKVGWLRTAPRTELWGDMVTAETVYFHFTYWKRDANAAADVLGDIDERYVEMCARLGLHPEFRDEPLHILIQPASLASDPGLFHFQGDRLTIPSPLQMPVPEGIADADVLRASILEPLAVMVLDKRMARYTNCYSWRSLQDGLRLWIGQEYGFLPSASRYQLRSTLLDWRNSDSPRLTYLTAYNTWCGEAYSPVCYGAYRDTLSLDVLAWTLVSYAMDSYGISALPSLIEAMGEHNSWEGLIPAAFGVTAAEFEQGWQEYFLDESLVPLR